MWQWRGSVSREAIAEAVQLAGEVDSGYFNSTDQ
jgi:hypothetical protein